MASYRLPASSPLDTLVRKTSQRRPSEPARPPRPAPPPGSPLIRSRFDQARDDESVYTDASSFRAKHAYSESKASTSYAGSSYSIYPADAGLEHYPPFNHSNDFNHPNDFDHSRTSDRPGHASEPSVDSYIDMNSPVDDDQPLADAQEAVLAGLTDTYRDDRPGSHQNYDSALRDSWPDAKRASEGVQRAGAGVQRAGSRGGRGAPYTGDATRGDRDAKRPTPGRQDNPHASNAFKSVYSNVDSVYSQDDYTPSGAGYSSGAGGRYTRNLDSIYSQDDDDQAYYADASGAAYTHDVPTVVVSSPITSASTSSRQPSRQPVVQQGGRQPIQQHIRNFSRPMPQSDAPPPGAAPPGASLPASHHDTLASPSNAFARPDSFAPFARPDSFAPSDRPDSFKSRPITLLTESAVALRQPAIRSGTVAVCGAVAEGTVAIFAARSISLFAEGGVSL
ncbi:hypothetical protein FB107DRAFT_288012 [Schizophyllum commune]